MSDVGDTTVFGLPQEQFTLKIDGRPYPMILDDAKGLVFEGNKAVQWLVDNRKISLVALSDAFFRRLFPLRDYLDFYAAMGVSLDSLLAMPDFKGLQVEHPLWKKKR